MGSQAKWERLCLAAHENNGNWRSSFPVSNQRGPSSLSADTQRLHTLSCSENYSLDVPTGAQSEAMREGTPPALGLLTLGSVLGLIQSRECAGTQDIQMELGWWGTLPAGRRDLSAPRMS